MPEIKYTPIPWRISEHEGDVIIGADGMIVANINLETDREFQEDEANAEFIVRACNTHESLVNVLTALVEKMQIIEQTSTLAPSPYEPSALLKWARVELAKANGEAC